MTKIFIDFEMTGLHKNTNPISIGLVSSCGKSFYAEFTDYDKSQIDDWLQKNVIDRLLHTDKINVAIGSWEAWNSNKKMYENPFERIIDKDADMSDFECIGATPMIRNRLEKWLAQFEHIEMYSDCLAYDWVLFCDIWGHAFKIPKNIYYIPFDICTSFKDKGINPDINREEFIGAEKLNEICSILKQTPESGKHNSRWDAYIIRACDEKLQSTKQ